MIKALAYLTMPALLGPVLGPPVGGFIVTYSSWRWIFLLNIPVGIVGIILSLLYIRPSRRRTVPKLDWVGFLLTGLGLASLVFSFEAMGRFPCPIGRWAAPPASASSAW